MTPPHERRNFSKIYEKMKLSKLSAMVPEFNFTQYLGKLTSDIDLLTLRQRNIISSRYHLIEIMSTNFNYLKASLRHCLTSEDPARC